MKISVEEISKFPVPEMLNADGFMAERSKGVHLSEIIREIAREAGLLKVEKVRFAGREFEISEEEEDLWNDYRKSGNLQRIPARMALGMAWEEWAARHLYPEMIWQPGEVERDGVAMTPDGVTDLGAKGKGIRLEEFKCTYKSSYVKGSPRDIQGEWLWLAQIKSYCGALETAKARLHVLYVNGNYHFDGEVPVYMRYGLEFTGQEIRDNWRLVMSEKPQESQEPRMKKIKKGR